jgi:HEAT repeat protein
VPGNDDTLLEQLHESLVLAAISDGGADRATVIGSLRAGEPRTRQLAVRAGARRGWLTLTDWRQALGDDSSEVRREAAKQLAREQSAPLVDELRAALGDPDALVAEAAAFACGELRASVAVPALIEVAAHHDDARCREAAVAALGAIGDERAKAAVIAALEDKPPVRRRAVVALSNFDGDDVDAALARASEDRDWQVRAAVDLLSREPGD